MGDREVSEAITPPSSISVYSPRNLQSRSSRRKRRWLQHAIEHTMAQGSERYPTLVAYPAKTMCEKYLTQPPFRCLESSSPAKIRLYRILDNGRIVSSSTFKASNLHSFHTKSRRLAALLDSQISVWGSMKGDASPFISIPQRRRVRREEKIFGAELAPAERIFIPIRFSAHEGKRYGFFPSQENLQTK